MKTLFITNEIDGEPGSLRAALEAAQELNEPVTIRVEDDSLRSFRMNGPVHIEKGSIFLDGSFTVSSVTFPLFVIEDGASLSIIGVRARHDRYPTDTGAGPAGESPDAAVGFAINRGALSLDNVSVSVNAVGRDATGQGAKAADAHAILNEAGAELSIRSSVFIGNIIGGNGIDGANGGDAAPIANFGILDVDRASFLGARGGRTRADDETAGIPGAAAGAIFNYGEIRSPGLIEAGDVMPALRSAGETHERTGLAFEPVHDFPGGSGADLIFSDAQAHSAGPSHRLREVGTYFGFARDEVFALGEFFDGTVLLGGEGRDTVSLWPKLVSDGIVETLDLGLTGFQEVSPGQNLSIAEFEDITGSLSPSHLIGDDGANRLDGGGGDDTLVGGGGDDTLVAAGAMIELTGGEGDDLFIVGAFTDAIISGGVSPGEDAGADTLIFDPAAFTADRGVTISLFETGPQDIAAEMRVLLSGIENLTGTKFRDTLIGDDGANLLDGAGKGGDLLLGNAGNDTINGSLHSDFIDGGADRDRLFGGLGDDTLIGRDGDDFINAGWGADKVLSGPGDDRVRTLHGDDIVRLGSGDDFARAGDGLDIVRGGGGADTLYGEDHDDRIFGGGGRDVIEGGPDSDFLAGGGGADLILGQAGADTLVGGGGADTLETGGLGNGLAIGGGGRDILRGASSDDTLDGGGGRDLLDGSASDDLLIGGNGRDTLIGGTGDDTLFGGKGSDDLVGGGGSDVFAFIERGGRDRILNYDQRQDFLAFRTSSDPDAEVDISEAGENLIVSYDGFVVVLLDRDGSSIDADDNILLF